MCVDIIRDRVARHLSLVGTHNTPPLSSVQLKALLVGIEVTTPSLQAHIAFSEQTYQRVQLDETSTHQLWLLCWKKGQRSAIHDHGGASGAVRILAGRAEERLYRVDAHGEARVESRRCFDSGQVSVVEHRQVHCLGPAEDGPDELITLHIYAPGLQEMKVYPLATTS